MLSGPWESPLFLSYTDISLAWSLGCHHPDLGHCSFLPGQCVGLCFRFPYLQGIRSELLKMQTRSLAISVLLHTPAKRQCGEAVKSLVLKLVQLGSVLYSLVDLGQLY